MRSVMDVLAAHLAICADCLMKLTNSRADSVIQELERHGAQLKEGQCVSCTVIVPVFSIR